MTPLASILGSGLLIIVPILERVLGVFALFGAYVISVALYLRIMAQYLVGFFIPAGSAILEPVVACLSVGLIVAIGAFRGFKGLDLLDRISLSVVLLLTTVLGAALLFHDGTQLGSSGLVLPPLPPVGPLDSVLIIGGLVISVQGFETVRYLGDHFDAVTRVRASRVSQLVSSSIYIGFVAVATPVMGLGTAAGADITLLSIIGRVAPWLAIPLVLSAVLSQFSAAIADTEAARGNLVGLSTWFTPPRPYLISGAAAIVIAATIPTFTLVMVASRAFAAYYAIEAIIAFRTSSGFLRKGGFASLAVVLLAITLFAQPVG